MKKKIIIITTITLILVLGCFISYKIYINVNPKIHVILKENRQVKLREKIKISDFIEEINGNIENDERIDTYTIGEKKLHFTYINQDKVRVKYDFTIEVVDDTKPIIWLGNSYSVTVGSNDNLLKKIMCADNYDANPTCQIIGDYDLNTLGEYPLQFKATDSSRNETTQNFTLKVNEKSNASSSTPTKTIFEDVVKTYKKENTEIGLDISTWQGDVDFEAIKNAGVEFVILRVGTSLGIDEENVLDKKFIQNIERAKEANIPVGLYFYSYANTKERAQKDALWVINQIKDYKIDLPIAFDWENWGFYNDFNLSLFDLSDIANTFLKTLENHGYTGMLYSSKSYLEKIWYPTEFQTWLAHYTDKTNYQGNYTYWQMCNDGVINGINGYVDINIRYKN